MGTAGTVGRHSGVLRTFKRNSLHQEGVDSRSCLSTIIKTPPVREVEEERAQEERRIG